MNPMLDAIKSRASKGQSQQDGLMGKPQGAINLLDLIRNLSDEEKMEVQKLLMPAGSPEVEVTDDIPSEGADAYESKEAAKISPDEQMAIDKEMSAEMPSDADVAAQLVGEDFEEGEEEGKGLMGKMKSHWAKMKEKK